MRRVFVSCISEEERFWTALLQDDVDGPIAQIDGDREEVIAWGKKQEAEQHWLHGPDGLLPLTRRNQVRSNPLRGKSGKRHAVTRALLGLVPEAAVGAERGARHVVIGKALSVG